jgi:hypothetical protein
MGLFSIITKIVNILGIGLAIREEVKDIKERKREEKAKKQLNA